MASIIPTINNNNLVDKPDFDDVDTDVVVNRFDDVGDCRDLVGNCRAFVVNWLDVVSNLFDDVVGNEFDVVGKLFDVVGNLFDVVGNWFNNIGNLFDNIGGFFCNDLLNGFVDNDDNDTFLPTFKSVCNITSFLIRMFFFTPIEVLLLNNTIV